MSLTIASASSSSVQRARPSRRARAGRCHQQGFLLAGELALRPRARLLAQRPFQIAFHEAPLGPVHGGTAHRHRAGNLLVAAAGIGRQQYLGALELGSSIIGAVVGFRLLGVERVSCGPLRLGGGTVKTAHGQLPVPAPATAWLLANSGASIAASLPGETGAGELLTPTGAAILETLAGFERPTMTVQSVGTGFGSKELPGAKICRVMIGETESASSEGDPLIVLETNIDDMNPQFVEILVERLFAAGALDAWTTAIGMKKGRPAIMVSALARPSAVDELTGLLIQQSTTLGVRQTQVAGSRPIGRWRRSRLAGDWSGSS